MLVALVLLIGSKLLVRGRVVLHILSVLPLPLLDAPMELVIRLLKQIVVTNILINHTLTSQVVSSRVLIQSFVYIRGERLIGLPALDLESVLTDQLV